MKKELKIFDDPKNGKRLRACLYVVVTLLFIGDFFVHKHVHFGWERWPGFFAVFGFVSYVFLVLTAKYILRPLVKRREEYYD